MYAQEVAGQPLFHLLHAEQHDYGVLALDVNLQILGHSLDVAYVGNVDPYDSMLGLEEYRLVVGRYSTVNGRTCVRYRRGCIDSCIIVGRLGSSRIFEFEAVLHTHGSTLEVVESERLEQIVDGINLESVHRIFRISRGENHKRRRCQRAHKVHAIHVGHIDIDKDGVNSFIVYYVACLDGALTFGYKVEKRYLPDVSCELLQCERLVVDNESLDHCYEFACLAISLSIGKRYVQMYGVRIFLFLYV